MELTSATLTRTKHKHTSTMSCLYVEKPIRNMRRQRKSLEDLSNLNRQDRYRPQPLEEDHWVDKFTFEMEIGQGAFGSVWRVKDEHGRARALKVMHKDKYRDI